MNLTYYDSIQLVFIRIRDMRMILRDHSTETRKEVGADIRWDVNRDPTQKVKTTLRET